MIRRLWLLICFLWMVFAAWEIDLKRPTGEEEFWFYVLGLAPLLIGWCVVPLLRWLFLAELPGGLVLWRRRR